MKGLGGLARQVTFIRRLKRLPPCVPVLRLSGGDLLFGHPAVVPPRNRKYFEKRARLTGRLLNDCGMDYAALGDADLALGYDFAVSALSGSGTGLLSGNIMHAKQDGKGRVTGTSRYAVVERGGLEVGIFALTRRPTSSSGHPRVTFSDPVESGRRIVAELKKRKCDLVILLTHMGMADDPALVEKLPGVDLAICGCCPSPLKKPRKIGTALYFAALFGGGQLGCIDVFVSGDGTRLAIKHRLVPMDHRIPADITVRKAVRKLELESRGIYGANVRGNGRTGGSASRTVPAQARSYWGADSCCRCHPVQFTSWRKSGHARALENLPPEGRRNPECLECHTTGHDSPANFSIEGIPGLPGVQCEACHRPLPPSRKGRFHGKVSTGIGECLRCHTPTRSPTFDPRRSWKAIACPSS